MATKKVTELVHADLGKNVVIDEPNGDRNSGELKNIHFHLGARTVSVSVDNADVRVDLDSTVEVND